MSGKHVIVLGSPDMDVVPGTVKMVADCGHDVVCAPATKAMYDEDPEKFETMCILCLDPEVLKESLREHGGFARVPGSREEYAAVMGEEEAKRMDTEIPWMKEQPDDH